MTFRPEQGLSATTSHPSSAPILMQFSSVLKKLLSVSLMTRSPLRLSMFFTHAFA